MKPENNIFQLARMIAKSLEKVLDKEEQEKIDEWIKASPRHESLYERVKQDKNLERRIVAQESIDFKMESRLLLAQLKRRKKNRIVRRMVYYAAMLTLPLVTLVWFARDENHEPVQQVEIASKENRASVILTLGEGQEIELTSKGKEIDKINGTIINTKENTIAYKQDSNATEGVSEKLIYNKLTVPRGGEYLLVLSDGTEIWLNAESEIRYPVQFTNKTREVFLKGEAFFSVTKNEEQPFIVHAGATQVNVLGTSFNLRCYPDEKKISTTLESGVVTMSGEGQESLKLLPGEQGVFDKEKLSLHKEKVETRFFTAWKDGRLVFREIRLEELLSILARWYDLNIYYTDAKAKETRFTGDLDKTDDFKTLLKMLERGKRVRCLVQDKNVYVSLT